VIYHSASGTNVVCNGNDGAPGAQGPAGLAWKGTWNATDGYNASDAASFSGSTYIALNSIPTNTSGNPDPATDAANWQLLVAKGDQGLQGSQGIQGEQGLQGPQGLQGIPGPAGSGSSDTGSDILTKVSGVSNSALSLQQGTKLGIGLSNPTAMLHLVPYNNSLDAMYAEMVADSGWATFKILHARGTTSNRTTLLNNDTIGRFVFWGHDGTAYNRSASVDSAVEGTPTLGSTPGRLMFTTVSAGSGSLTERMRITSGGNVGIGTTSPTQKLDINGGLRLSSTAAKPATCDATVRGTFWYDTTTSPDDTLYICTRTGGTTYLWKKVTLTN
jgi:hypothetical protein